LLTQPIARVAAVEQVGKSAIEFAVFRQRRVEQQHGHFVTGEAADEVAPAAHVHVAPFDPDRDSRRRFLEQLFRIPRYGGFRLIPFLIELLPEIAFAMQQGDSDDGNLEIGTGSKRVAGENAEPSAVRWNRLLEADL